MLSYSNTIWLPTFDAELPPNISENDISENDKKKIRSSLDLRLLVMLSTVCFLKIVPCSGLSYLTLILSEILSLENKITEFHQIITHLMKFYTF